jgi:hypothetical protein
MISITAGPDGSAATGQPFAFPAFAAWQNEKRWVAWHPKIVEPSKPPRKIPYGKDGLEAKVNDPNTWLTFAEAERLREARAYDGLGMTLGFLPDGSYLCGFDLDTCFDANGTPLPWAQAILDLLSSTYAEISPSSTGVKLWMMIAQAEVRPFLQLLGVDDKSWGCKRTIGTNGTPHGSAIEFYTALRFFTVTGHRLPNHPERVVDVDRSTLLRLAQIIPQSSTRGSGGDVDDPPPPLEPIDAEALKAKLEQALKRNAKLRTRYEGNFDGLPDGTRNARDMSLGAILKLTGFSFSEMRKVLIDWQHGAGRERADAGDERYFDRIWRKSRAPDDSGSAQNGTPPPGKPPPGPTPEPSPGPNPSPARAKGRPLITLRAGAIERTVNQLEKLLMASDRGLYQRGGLVVSTTVTKMQTWDGKTVYGQVIEERGDDALTEDADCVARFEKWDARNEKMKACDPPAKIIRTLKDRKSRLHLPTLVGVFNCPSITVGGRLLTIPGFDRATGLLYDPRGFDFPPVPASPDRAMAEKALERVNYLLHTFKFVGANDRAVAQSLLFTAIARRGLPSAPLHALDATVAGSGKTMIVDIASILATGHEAIVVTQGRTVEEFEKRLSTALMKGSPLVAIDNCSQPLEGDLLCAALTQQVVGLRILGFTKDLETRCNALLTATGNNLVMLGELTRRGLIGRLDPEKERPELDEFDYNPIADAKENRGELVTAILTVLRAYHVAGRPGCPKPLQSFVDWSNTVRGALRWMDQGDPIVTMERLRESDPTLRGLEAVLTVWHQWFHNVPMTAAAAVKDAIEMESDDPHQPDGPRHFKRRDLHDALYQVAGRRGNIDTTALGNWLRHYKGRPVTIVNDNGDEVRVRITDAGKLHGNLQWKVEEVDEKKLREPGEEG